MILLSGTGVPTSKRLDGDVSKELGNPYHTIGSFDSVFKGTFKVILCL